MKGYDFAGWATKNDLKCADGLVIRKNAFKVNDGQKVPLVWNHRHDNPENVLGHAILENRDEGVYAYGYFNDTPRAKHTKNGMLHGDIGSMSIWANNLVKDGVNVLHGAIREVSLVLAGANPGACIESVVAHGVMMEDFEDEGIIYTDESIVISHSVEDVPEDDMDEKLAHADKENGTKDEKKVEKKTENTDEKKDNSSEKTVGDVLDTLNEDQKAAVAILLGRASMQHSDEDDNDDDENNNDSDGNQEDNEMKHNIFEGQQTVVQHGLTRDERQQIIADAKKIGSLRETLEAHMEEGGIIAHALDKTGMEIHTGTQTYGVNDLDMLFPEFKTINNQKQPVFISRNMEWVSKVMNGVYRSPFTRIKTLFADITEDEARAKGYLKGKEKKEEVFTTLKRKTDPQTIYKKQKLDRDDIIDITDFDVVQWIRAEMRMMLDEEIARAILIGDGRSPMSDDKIDDKHVRPIVTDVPLFNIKRDVPYSSSDSDENAKSFINNAIRARKGYKGSGNPTLFTTEDVLTDLLLLEDGIGHKMYKSQAELATALRVKEIVTVEVMENQKVDNKDLLGVVVNLSDYAVGCDKGGQINTFDDFDIDFNQYKYLIETRISGALVMPFSAITLLKAGATPTPTP